MAFSIIHPREIDGILKRQRAMVIDVREPDSYRKMHYPQAKNLPYDTIEQWMWQLPKKQALILYCDYGSTSLMAARKLGREGYEVYTVIGGMDAMKKLW